MYGREASGDNLQSAAGTVEKKGEEMSGVEWTVGEGRRGIGKCRRMFAYVKEMKQEAAPMWP